MARRGRYGRRGARRSLRGAVTPPPNVRARDAIRARAGGSSGRQVWRGRRPRRGTSLSGEASLAETLGRGV